MKIKKGDQVKILTGKDKGKTGSVLRVIPEKNRMVIEGVNTFQKKMRPKRGGEKGQIVTLSRAIDHSNVSLVCKNCKKTTRIGTRMNGEKKERFCKKCDAAL